MTENTPKNSGGVFGRLWAALRRPGRWRAPVAAFAMVAIPLGLFGGTSIGLSVRPDSCVACHEMQPYFDQWRVSTHKSVICVECHTDPGPAGAAKIVTSSIRNTAEHLAASYVTPIRASVHDSSCLRCHTRESRPEIVYESSLRVAHSRHEGIACADCHGRLVHTVGQEVTPSILTHADDTKTCNVCHTPDKSPHGPSRVDCASCHSGEIPGHVLSDRSGVPPRQGCIDCHTKERVSAPENCQTCHVSPHGIDRACNTCHTSTTTWSEKKLVHSFPLVGKHATLTCSTCHKGGVQFPVPGAPAPALQKGELPSNANQQKPSADCKTCHKSPEPHFGTECAMCHNPSAPFKKS